MILPRGGGAEMYASVLVSLKINHYGQVSVSQVGSGESDSVTHKGINEPLRKGLGKGSAQTRVCGNIAEDNPD